MSSYNAVPQLPQAIAPAHIFLPQVLLPAEPKRLESWYALHTRPRHEKMVSQRLAERGVTAFLPLMMEIRRWSDRKKSVELPLFGCYVFAKFAHDRAERMQMLRTDGVLGLVGSHGEGAPIPEAEISAVRAVIAGSLPWTEHPFLEIGRRVRIRSGALDGLEGILMGRSGERSLVVSVSAIQRSLAVRLEGYEVEAI